MKHDYKTQSVCAQLITFDLNGDVVTNIKFLGGCNGNLKAIGRLVEGADAAQIAALLQGNDCGGRGTSCADQLSKAISEALNKHE